MIQLDAQQPGALPEAGYFAHDMPGFVRSCKIATADIIASRRYSEHGALTPMDIFALHLYTRAELFGAINRAFRDQDRSEMDKWKTVTAAARVAA